MEIEEKKNSESVEPDQIKKPLESCSEGTPSSEEQQRMEEQEVTEKSGETTDEKESLQNLPIPLEPEGMEHLPVVPETTVHVKQPMSRGNLLFFAGCLLITIALVFNGIQLWRRYNLVNTSAGSLTSATDNQYAAYLAQMIVSDQDLSAFMEAYQYVIGNSTLDPDTGKLMSGAIEGMLGSLDDKYAAYYDKETFSVKMDDSSGFYSGIGASVIENGGYITIVQPYEDSPAATAGLLTGDQILAVDGTDVVGWSTDDAVMLVRGEVNTDVVLTIRRPGTMEDLEITVTRATVETKTVTGTLSDEKIADIKLTSFNDQTGKQLSALIEEFKTQGMKGLILDLRNNGGGTHTGVVESAQCLVPEGKIFSIVYANGKTDEELSTLKDRGFPMVVLINQYSASASEVLAGALQDSGVPLIGVQSYGKGVGQSSVDLSNGSGIAFTTSDWYTRDGHQVAGVGLTPNLVVVDAWFPLGTIDVAKLKPSDLSLLQYKLNVLGFSTAEETEYGEATQSSVAAYQTSKGLEATGQLDLATVQNLNADCYTLLDGNEDPQYKKAMEVLQGLLIKV
ncbi:MAG TPA: S41 family peptidase [Bacillota bacterium]|nr:S41 family peptidase [Bacillota bacterium]